MGVLDNPNLQEKEWTWTPSPTKVKEVLKHSDTWHKLTDKDQYEFPGFETDLQSSQKPLANLRDWRRLPFEANTRPHFIWDDNQLPIRGSQTTKHNIIVEGKKTSLYVRRGPCEGVKTCAGPDCEYVVYKDKAQIDAYVTGKINLFFHLHHAYGLHMALQ